LPPAQRFGNKAHANQMVLSACAEFRCALTLNISKLKNVKKK